MRLSARNQISGTIVSIARGPVNATVKLDIGGGQFVSATMTAEAADALELVDGMEATAIFKASAVLIGVE